MTMLAVIALVLVGFVVAAYVYGIGSKRTCPRCGSRRANSHLGVAKIGPIFNCQDCGAVFNGDGSLLDSN